MIKDSKIDDNSIFHKERSRNFLLDKEVEKLDILKNLAGIDNDAIGIK